MILNTKLLYILLLFFTAASANDEARKGNEAYNNGNFEEAEQLYATAIEQEPENAKLYFNLGNAQAKQGKIEEAIQSYLEFKNLTESADHKSKAEYNIGTLLAENEKWKPAASHFKNSLILNPQDKDAKFNYERALREQKQDEQEQQNDENQPPPDPSEYAKAMKKQAEKLVEERRYKEAHELMMNAMKADETVRAFSSFINRIKDVAEINSN